MISVRFSCAECGVTDELVQVPERQLPTDDVVKWVKTAVVNRCGLRHKQLSPDCKCRTISDIVVPMGEKDDPNPWIGKQTDNVPPLGIGKRHRG